MKGEGKRGAIQKAWSIAHREESRYIGIISFIVFAFTFLTFIGSFADTTTYEYDDNARKVTIKRGTQGAQSYLLVVTQSGTGTGMVTSSPAGINCGGDCSENYTSVVMLTLTDPGLRLNLFYRRESTKYPATSPQESHAPFHLCCGGIHILFSLCGPFSLNGCVL